MKYGLIISKIETREEGAEHILGAMPKYRGRIINEVGDWSKFLPVGELQNKGKFEPSACASFAINNAKETQYKFLTGKDNNSSDRALAIGSETNPAQGNDPHKVSEYARKKLGFAPEDVLPFDSSVDTLEKFYSPNPLTSEIIARGNEFFNEYDFAHEWVFSSGTPEEKKAKLKEALKAGTVCVSVHAWNYENGRYTKPVGATDNHFVMLVKYENDCPVIFDSYAETDQSPYLKTLDPLYDFSIAKVFYLEPSKPKLDWIQSVINWIKSYLPFLKKQVDAVAPINFELPPPVIVNEWDTPEKARHSARVIMDTFGLLWSEKDLLCAVIQAESGFNTKAVNQQTKDYGICQINSFYWIGEGKYFASIEEVLNKPEKSVKFMVEQYRAGHLDYWVAYKNLSYKRYL